MFRNQEPTMAFLWWRQTSICSSLALQMSTYPNWAPRLFLWMLTFVNSLLGSREFALSRSVSSVRSLLSRWTFVVWMEALPEGGQEFDCFMCLWTRRSPRWQVELLHPPWHISKIAGACKCEMLAASYQALRLKVRLVHPCSIFKGRTPQ